MDTDHADDSRTDDAHPVSALQETFKKVQKLRKAGGDAEQTGLRLGIAGLFLALVFVLTAIFVDATSGAWSVVAVAAAIGGYMALNIGANDVANSMGPPVGSGAISMFGALIIAAVGNTAGAVIAGGDVVSTISKGIIDPKSIEDAAVFVTAMMAALLAAALWLNLATYIGAPVSTTHAIVGGVMGAGIAATGLGAVNWMTMGKIAASWVISPVLGGFIAAAFLMLIRHTITQQPDKITAARKWVPVFIGIMGATFAMYLMTKGLKKVWKFDPASVALAGIVFGVVITFVARPLIVKQSDGLENRKKAVHSLFAFPLICAAALLTFAHGANDVANAVGPLAAIAATVADGTISAKVSVPSWILLIGGVGISIGLGLFGPRLVRTVGKKITKINPIRAFCVALSAGITVLIASALGLPVSSTHIAVGGVFGVGLLREVIHNRKALAMAAVVGAQDDDSPTPLLQRPKLKRKLVRRKFITTIIAAWLITVPLAALLSAALFMALHFAQQHLI